MTAMLNSPQQQVKADAKNQAMLASSTVTQAVTTQPTLDYFPYFFAAQLATTAAEKQDTFRLRHAVYCEELQFEPISDSGLEQDEFDKRSIHCFIKQLSSNSVAGTVRLITAKNADDNLPIELYCNNTAGNLSPKYFDHREICEISRLAVPANLRRRIIAKNTNSTPLNTLLEKLETDCYSSIAVALYLIATLISVKAGKHHAYVMIEPALARILRRVGIHFEKIGDCINFNGKRAPYYLDMRTVTTTLKPDYLTLHYLLAKQLGTQLSAVYPTSIVASPSYRSTPLTDITLSEKSPTYS
ncbi:PEP-CTERM/exosortase system-associated acyltransferase [Rheinheimera sp. WS51]|uniref:PEP-CTERM/exosortase system-associated acyltransferase n=1 Tax=Rheinheimera sp. WS51 TaxID=3425886 RepID=UPI003D942F4F